jgi:hypothetical protein
MPRPRIIRRYHALDRIYTLAWTTCGKKNCGKCPHGPYWYVHGTKQNGQSWKRYIGKQLTLDDERRIGEAVRAELTGQLVSKSKG